MLKQLTVINYKLIDKLQIELRAGLTIISGETGAGKSILLDAIKLILGDRGSAQLIKDKDKPLIVEATFSIKHASVKSMLTEYEIDIDGDELHIYRKIDSDGKNSIRINGMPANVKILKDIGDNLIDLCSQHQHQSLFLRSNHKLILDSFGGEQVRELKAQVEQLRTRYLDLKAHYSGLQNNISAMEKEKDFLSFQLSEIEEAGLKEQEEEMLSADRQRLENATTLASDSSIILKNLAEADEYVRKAYSTFQNLTRLDDTVTTAQESINTVMYTLEDLVQEIRSYNEKIEFSPEMLDEINDRLFLIDKLKRKYGPSYEDIFVTRDKLKSSLEQFAMPENNVEHVEEELLSVEKELAGYCTRLSKLRQQTAAEIEGRIAQELRDLMLPHAEFRISVAQLPDEQGLPAGEGRCKLFADGIDEVEFLFSANPGTPAGELKDIVSGGELSRVMLALKTVFMKSGTTQTIIFDEIDTGVSGHTAAKIAAKLKELSGSFQIICVTHLATIAAQGDAHLLIKKDVEHDRTLISLEKLTKATREEEIARLLGGTQTKITYAHAKELLKEAHK